VWRVAANKEGLGISETFLLIVKGGFRNDGAICDLSA
jgi:hypothetical protein